MAAGIPHSREYPARIRRSTAHQDRLRNRIARLDSPAGDLGALRLAVERELRAAIGYDFASFGTVDPATLLGTSCVVWGLDYDLDRERRVFVLEFKGDDVNHYVDLAGAPTPAGALGLATGGRRQESRRFRELLEPLGVHDDLRVVFRDRAGRAWGELSAYRGDTRAAFTAAEVELAAAVSEPIADRLRAAMLEAAAAAPERLERPPGMLVVDPSGAIEYSNPPADEWLGMIDDRGRLPSALSSLIAAARSGVNAPRASLPARSGHAIVVHASRLKAEGASSSDRIALVIEGVRDVELADAIASAWDLTAREREVVALVARGMANKRVAATLGISAYTVQDHLRAAFAKAGVATRAELLAAMRAEHYEPRVAAGSTPGPYGWYLDDEIT